MAGCEEYEKLINALLDDGLTAEQERSLREHVRTCPDCRRLLTAVTAAVQVLREEEMAEPPQGLTETVMARIAGAQSATAADNSPPPRTPISPHHANTRGRSRWVRWGAAACLVLVAGGAVFAFRSGLFTGKKSAYDTNQAANLVRAVDIDGAADSIVPRESGGDGMGISAAPEDAEEARNDMDTGGGDTPTVTSAVSPTPVAAVIIWDAARTEAGTVPPENREALQALLEGGTPAGTTADWDMLFTADMDGLTYTFATDAEGRALIWWDSAGSGPIRSPGTLEDLRKLILFTDLSLPEAWKISS